MRSFIGLLRRQQLVVAAMMLVTVGVAVGATLARPPLYIGRAEIVVEAAPSKSPSGAGSVHQSLQSRLLVPTEIRVLNSQEVKALATERLGFSPTVSARQVGLTDVISVAAMAASPERARATATLYAAAYVDFRRTQAGNDLLARSREIEGELGQLRERIDQAAGSEQGVLEEQYRFFQDVQVQLQVDAASSLSQARLMSPTSDDLSRARPGVTTIAAWAMIVGLVLGVDLALLFGFLDASVRTRADLERASGGLPVLGAIPETHDGHDIGFHLRSTPTAEAYRSLQTVLLAVRRDPPIRLLQVTSPGPTDGRTTAVANLGLALAEGGRRVTLVDADLRNPALHERFDLRGDIGLSSVATGEVALLRALQDVPGVTGLRVLPAGPLPRSFEDYLTSQVAAVLEVLRQRCDIVVIDSPPVLASSYATVLSRFVDATVVLAAAGRTRYADVAETVEQLRKVDAPLTGVVLMGSASTVSRH